MVDPAVAGRRRLGGELKIQTEVLEELHAHARECYPDECCGVVVMDGDGRQWAVRIRNIQDEMHRADPERYPRTARNAYTGHPQDLKRALDDAQAPGRVLAAFYHSHPDHKAYFSAEDVAQATPFGEPSYPDAVQVVVSIYGDEIRDVKAFAWSADAADFVEVQI